MYAEPHIDRRLPPEAEMDRDDALDAFLAVVNTVQPDHSGDGQAVYPLARHNVEYGVTRSMHARCGPRGNRWSKVRAYYATRLTYINRLSRERHLALLVHEATHLVQHTGNNTSSHPPAFWREMAFLALELRDALADGVLDDVFGDVDIDRFLHEVVKDPNSSTVDRRSWTVDETKAELEDLLGLA